MALLTCTRASALSGGRTCGIASAGTARGNPTSAASGGGSGALSKPGTTCNASTPPAATAVTFPTARHRTLVPFTATQAAAQVDVFPRPKVHQLLRAIAQARGRDRDPLRTSCTFLLQRTSDGPSRPTKKLREEGVPIPPPA
jgi:hypothetical protein